MPQHPSVPALQSDLRSVLHCSLTLILHPNIIIIIFLQFCVTLSFILSLVPGPSLLLLIYPSLTFCVVPHSSPTFLLVFHPSLILLDFHSNPNLCCYILVPACLPDQDDPPQSFHSLSPIPKVFHSFKHNGL